MTGEVRSTSKGYTPSIHSLSFIARKGSALGTSGTKLGLKSKLDSVFSSHAKHLTVAKEAEGMYTFIICNLYSAGEPWAVQALAKTDLSNVQLIWFHDYSAVVHVVEQNTTSRVPRV